MTLASKERKFSIVANFGPSSSAARALDSLQRWADERGLQVERAAARPSDGETTLQALPSRLRRIVERVAQEYELPPYAVIEGRGAMITEARYCAFFLSKKLATSMNAEGIAAAFRRDPTTVRDGIRSFFQRLRSNQDLSTRVSRLLEQLRDTNSSGDETGAD